MRLKEIYIERYGPFNQVRIEFCPGVQPIFGDNESGKTLLVDCIIKMLSGKGVGWGHPLDRVAENPEGFIILEDDNKEFKLEKGQNLADYLSIDPTELRNIFIIREADLKIPEEAVFYERITDKITGLKIQDIRRIIEKLREIGRLTNANNLSNAKNFGWPKSKLQEARNLTSEIEEYLKEAEKMGVPQLEANIFQLKIRENLLREKIELLRKAKEKDDFTNLENKLAEAEKLLKDIKNKPAEEIISSLQVKFDEYMKKELGASFLQRINHFSKKLSFVSLPLATAVWFILFISKVSNLLELALPFILFIISISSIVMFVYSSRRLSNIDSIKKELFMETEKIGITLKSLTELPKELERLRQEIKRLRDLLHQDIGVLRNSLNVNAETEEETLKMAKIKLLEKKATIDLDIDLKFDEEELEKAEAELSGIYEKLKQLNEELSGHKEALKSFSERAYKLDFPFFMDRELDVEVENLESLKLLKKELEDFSRKIEEEAEFCKTAIEIFEEMEKEEEARIEELFGEQSIASKIFQELTEGRYNKVFYDSNSKEIVVVRPSGEEFPASKLSKGAFDQLYMSIRIDLAQRILGEKKGFFIMDDAFLSSGPRRFKKALKIIKKLADMGWNIIYFTVKLEDAKSLAKISKNEIKELSPLP